MQFTINLLALSQSDCRNFYSHMINSITCCYPVFQVDERMQSFKEAYDIVVVDDHSIELVDLLLMKILRF